MFAIYRNPRGALHCSDCTIPWAEKESDGNGGISIVWRGRSGRVSGCTEVAADRGRKERVLRSNALFLFFSPPHMLLKEAVSRVFHSAEKTGGRGGLVVCRMLFWGLSFRPRWKCVLIYSAPSSPMTANHILLISKGIFTSIFCVNLFSVSLLCPLSFPVGQIPARHGSTSSYSSHSLCQHEHTYPSLISSEGIFLLTR